jgi:hypothetical protein
MCREGVNAEWDAFSDHLKTVCTDKPDRTEPCAGEIRPIAADKGRWSGSDYLNPPVVLILGIDDSRRTALCCVVYPDHEPAAPGDLLLDEEDTGFMDVMVETWNTLTVRQDDLALCLGALRPEMLDDVRRYIDQPDRLPGWAMAPLSIRRENDPRIEFRTIERRVAAGFAVRPLDVLFAKPLEFFEKMKHLAEGIVLPDSGRSVSEAVLTFRFPDSMIPAHAHDGGRRVPADYRVMMIVEDRMANYFPSVGEVTSDEVIRGRRIIMGQGSVPPGSDLFCFQAGLFLPSGALVDADSSDFDEHGMFSAEFDLTGIHDPQSGRPVFLAVYRKCDPDGGK